MGRQLCRQDFTDFPFHEINAKGRSLRLQDRLSTEPSEAAPSEIYKANRGNGRKGIGLKEPSDSMRSDPGFL
jgi:hypothetical protein